MKEFQITPETPEMPKTSETPEIKRRNRKGPNKYKKKPNGKNATGKPTSMSEETLKKLREGFSVGMTDEQATRYADISQQTLYNYCKVHTEYVEYKEALKRSPEIKAKINLVKSINNGDINDSKRWLERKSRNEFATRQEGENTNTNITIEPTIDDIKKALKRI